MNSLNLDVTTGAAATTEFWAGVSDCHTCIVATCLTSGMFCNCAMDVELSPVLLDTVAESFSSSLILLFRLFAFAQTAVSSSGTFEVAERMVLFVLADELPWKTEAQSPVMLYGDSMTCV